MCVPVFSLSEILHSRRLKGCLFINSIGQVFQLQCSGLGNKISGQRTDMFLKVSVPELKISVPKRCNIGKFAEMVSQGTD